MSSLHTAFEQPTHAAQPGLLKNEWDQVDKQAHVFNRLKATQVLLFCQAPLELSAC